VLPSACATSASSTSRPYTSYVRHCAMPSRRMWPPTVLPAAWAGVLAAPSGLTSLTSDAAPCHWAGCDCQQCGQQRVGKGASSTSLSLHLLREMLRHATVSGVAAHGAAISGCERSSGTSRHCNSYERGGARPGCRMWATGGSIPAYLLVPPDPARGPGESSRFADVGSCSAPGVSAHSAAFGACAKGQTGPHGWRPLRAMQHHGVAPEGIAYSAAIGVW